MVYCIKKVYILTETKKNGKRRAVQRYECLNCGKQFQSKRRRGRLRRAIWQDYVFGKQTIDQLAGQYQRSEKWIRGQLEKVSPNVYCRIPLQPITAVADITFFGRSYGILVFREPHLKKNLYFKEIVSETPLEYAEGRYSLEKQGFTFKAVTTDGKRGIREVFKGIPTQMCHFHQIAIINRWLGAQARTRAELRRITLNLTKTNEETLHNN